MPRRTFTDTAGLTELLQRRRGVVTHQELVDLGMPRSTIMHQISSGGRWQRLLPGVVLAHRGSPTTYERRLGCLAYGGPQSMLTGGSALAEHGLRVPVGLEHLLIPHSSQRTSHHFVTVERTRVMPEPVLRRNLRIVPLSRAVIDHARRPASLDDVRAVVAEAVQRRWCAPHELAGAIQLAATQRTAHGRRAVREVTIGLRSVAEAKARDVLATRQVRPLWWNPRLFTTDGEFIGSPDAYDEAGVALQIDSMEYHLSPADYRRTQQALAAYARHGIVVVSVAPADVLTEPDQFTRTWVDAVGIASLRDAPKIVVVPVGPRAA
jgi:hypothetical protein